MNALFNCLGYEVAVVHDCSLFVWKLKTERGKIDDFSN